ncbi:MAG: flagellar motor protein [Acidobacteriota bacterium]
MKRSALGGILLAVLGICAGLLLDGGKIGQMLQPTAALIVFGGTIGAVIVQFPLPLVLQAIVQLKVVFLGQEDHAPKLIEDLTRYTLRARKHGMLSLDSELEKIEDPFLRQCLTHAVDGIRPADLRETMEIVMDAAADKEESMAGVFDAAGGFAPTVGILGAVIGLIQVMQRLENITEVGKGIAVAFVATLYGVGSANLFFLPCAGRIRSNMQRRQTLRELVLEGVVAVMEKSTPRALEKRLAIYLDGVRQAPTAAPTPVVVQ